MEDEIKKIKIQLIQKILNKNYWMSPNTYKIFSIEKDLEDKLKTELQGTFKIKILFYDQSELAYIVQVEP